MASSPPSPTLFVQNLPDKVLKKPELRRTLGALFGLYGKVLDVVHTRSERVRGTAFVVFRDLSASTAAMRGLDGEAFFGRQLKISYARSVSHSTVLHSQGPEALYALKSGIHTSASAAAAKASKMTVSGAQKRLAEEGKKRAREDEEEEEEDESEEEPEKKKGKVDEGDDDDAMEEESDEDAPDPATKKQAAASTPAVAKVGEEPTPVLFVQGLPPFVTVEMLSPLFQQYPGLLTIKLLPSLPGTTPAPGTNAGIGFVTYESAVQAGVAKEVLDGFLLSKGINMSVSWAARE